MEKIDKNIFIDYAHTPDAMTKVLRTFKSIYTDKRLIVLFGCGGDRDPSKRKSMGQIASTYSDVVILTSDNSRTEDELKIIKDIESGINPKKSYYIIPNRRDAIEFAVKIRNNDILLLLGKGHEEYMIGKNGKSFFSERKIVMEAVRKYDICK